MKNTNFYWGGGIGFLGLFCLVLIEPSPDKVTFRCDRSIGVCAIETTALFRTKTKSIKIEEIQYAHYESFLSNVRGYKGPNIKLNNGNDISIGTGSFNTSEVNEQKNVDNINNFISNQSIKHITVTHQSMIPAVIYAAGFLLLGVLFISKSLKPYILKELNKR